MSLGPQAFVTETDDLGEFRIGSLPAGRYQVTLERVPCQPVQLGGIGMPGVIASCDPALMSRAAFAPDAWFVEAARGEERVVELRLATTDPSPAVPVEPRAGGGSIAGRVLSSSGAPLQGARVTAGTGNRAVGSAIADASGRYTITGLAAGTYRVAANKPGFHGGEHGRSRLVATHPLTIELTADEARQDIDVVLPRGGVIAGTIRDRYGDPVEGVILQAWERRFVAGRPIASRTTAARAQRTDDRGQYRLHGLLPGAYYVVAIDTPLMPSDLTTGPWSQDLSGQQESVDLQNHAHLFYPGRSSGADAWTVRIDVGFDALGTDMVFDAVPGSRVHGTVVDATGRPLGSQDGSTFTLRLVERTAPDAPALQSRAAVRGPNGTFEFRHVPTGEYVIQVRMHETTSTGPRPLREFAAHSVVVGDGDLGPLLVQTSAGARVSGTIVLDGDQTAVAASAFRLGTAPVDPELSVPATATIREGGTFEVGGLLGPQRFTLTGAPPGWWLASVTIDGLNAAEHPVSLVPARMRGRTCEWCSRARAQPSPRVSPAIAASRSPAPQ